MNPKLIGKSLFAAAAFAAGALFADTETVGGYTWTYSVSGDSAKIYKRDGSGEGIAAISPLPTGYVYVPTTLGGKPVTCIGAGAFSECDEMEGVKLPAHVTRIENYAFAGCSALMEITIPKGVTTIYPYTFNQCSALESVFIPSSVTTIEMYAFANCAALENVVIPLSVTSIGSYAFANCSSLAVVTMPNRFVSEAPDATVFANCPESLTISYSDVDVGTPLFTIDESGTLTSVDLNGAMEVAVPNTVKSIGRYAFNDLVELESVSIPASVTEVNSWAFDGCSGLISIDVASGNPNYMSVNGLLLTKDGSRLVRGVNGDVVIPDGVTEIVDSAFYGFANLTGVRIPSGVTKIEEDAFGYCSSLPSVSIPASVTEIEGGAFSGCSALMSIDVASDNSNYMSVKGLLLTKYGMTLIHGVNGDVVIPDGVTEIGYSAFCGFDNLTSVTIPDSVTEIGGDAFTDCSSLMSVTLPIRFTEVVSDLFSGCPEDMEIFFVGTGTPTFTIDEDGVLTEVILNGATEVTIPDTVTSIEDRAFAELERLVSVTIPASVTSINPYAFDYCSGLTSITVASDNPNYKSVNGFLLSKDGSILVRGINGDVVIPDGVTVIGDSAFYGFDNLTSVQFPNSVTVIEEYAFGYCSGLTSVSIPNSVTEIQSYAFEDCEALLSVTLPRWCETELSEDVFEGCPVDMAISYNELPYVIVFHRNDASDGKEAKYAFDYGVETRLPSLNKLGWARKGFTFLGWATSVANAAKGVVWKKDWSVVSTAVGSGKTLNVYGVWALKSDSYAIQFIRNDGAGTWRTVGFTYGEKTRLPSLANGLGWARRGYDFKGWALSTADANAGKIWKTDWSYVATAAARGKTLTVYAVWALKPGYYQIRYNKNDGTTKWRATGFQYGVSTKLSTVKALGWSVSGKTFKGWASSKANADAKKVWKTDGAAVATAVAEGKTLNIYAIWE